MELGGILLSGDSVEIHFRIDKECFQSAWNSSQDWSYQHNKSVVEPHYFIIELVHESGKCEYIK